ncbi:uncharacterized protein FOMMEDRAFT_167479 [Fomitiporia mediterranea MF3/22]|uniref:uncharacterized protein n=1 Tax=Fomitiporia mediterranea (strain MF3/22) TaxID=694068 RepID=UPI000440745A|nr:uncharacterized protein FOMMEDRAFT_167479 [Fomitiporia mediterranea MF3/22]EJD04250.1 hypothetical protein FOMMEDRAFT_167479 [Fomitiporia mediterranea MF3/22]
MKIISRDTSLTTQYKDNLATVLRDIERWISEAKVASSAVIFHRWGAVQTGDGEDEKERWALERLCDALIERGGLVPVSGKKRLASNLKSSPILPQGLISVWTPLLSTLKTSHPSFPPILVSAITDFLICRPATPNSDDFSRKDLSYELCLAAWAAWCVEQWETDSLDVRVENYLALRRKDVVLGLISALAIRADEPTELRKGANALLSLLVRDDPELEEISTSLLTAAQRSVSIGPNDAWMDTELRVMEERLDTLISSLDAENAEQAPVLMDIDKETSSGSRPSRKVETDVMPKGWTKVPAESWSCPIGIFVN